MLKHTILFAAVVGLVLAMVPAAQAEEVITTPGDGYEDPYRLMFTTNNNHNALSTDINDYNTIVNNVANNLDGWSGSQLESLDAIWTCVGSTATVDARTNTNTRPGVDPDYPIYNLRGEKLANDYADFWDGSFIDSREVRPTHDGTTGNDNVWTGSINGGVQDPDYPLGAVNVRQGIPFGGYPRWQYNQEKPPGSNWWLYGISTPISVDVDGDLDGDGDVDLDDVGLFEAQFGSQSHGPAPGPPYTADFDEDDDVDLDDFLVMRDNYEPGVFAPDGASTPEPATMSLLALGGLMVLRRRRKA